MRGDARVAALADPVERSPRSRRPGGGRAASGTAPGCRGRTAASATVASRSSVGEPLAVIARRGRARPPRRPSRTLRPSRRAAFASAAAFLAVSASSISCRISSSMSDLSAFLPRIWCSIVLYSLPPESVSICFSSFWRRSSSIFSLSWASARSFSFGEPDGVRRRQSGLRWTPAPSSGASLFTSAASIALRSRKRSESISCSFRNGRSFSLTGIPQSASARVPAGAVIRAWSCRGSPRASAPAPGAGACGRPWPRSGARARASP